MIASPNTDTIHELTADDIEAVASGIAPLPLLGFSYTLHLVDCLMQFGYDWRCNREFPTLPIP